MSSLAEQLGMVLAGAFADAGCDPALGVVEPSSRPDLADFQCNGAMAAAHSSDPRSLAAAIAGRVDSHRDIASASCAGPGFINLTVSDAALGRCVDQIRSDPACGGGTTRSPERILIDFGGLNIAKPMHIGHLRSLMIGDSLQRLLRFIGHEVTSDIHLGDWGLQMGLILAQLRDTCSRAQKGEVIALTLDELDTLYRRAQSRTRDDEDFLSHARLATRALQDGDSWHRQQWQQIVEVSIAGLRADLDDLGISFDLWKGESDVADRISPLIEDLRTRGIVTEDDGALIVRVAKEGDSKVYPPVMMQNARGASTYHATDVATIADRVDHICPDRIIYVVDQRQRLHFEQIFRASEITGLFAADRLEHIAFGTMNGRDGKPFRTRAGGVLRLSDLVSAARQTAAEKLAHRRGISGPSDLSDAERTETDKIALAAIKFADLCTTRTTNYVFDLEQFMSFEGRTGPYLLYAVVRIRSVMRRIDHSTIGPCVVSHPTERALALHLDRFGTALATAAERRMPHVVCDHAYGLAQSFAAFYASCPIATAEPAQRPGRLALADATMRQLTVSLDILGIDVPETM